MLKYGLVYFHRFCKINDDNLLRIANNQFLLRLSVPGCDCTTPVRFLYQTEK